MDGRDGGHAGGSSPRAEAIGQAEQSGSASGISRGPRVFRVVLAADRGPGAAICEPREGFGGLSAAWDGSGPGDGFRFKAETQVRFGDLDPLNHVNNAVYLTYFEIARIRYFRALIAPPALSHINMIVAEATCTYRSAALLDEHLDIWIKTETLKRSSFVLAYRIIERESGRLIATGRTVQVIYDYEAGQSYPIPAELRARFEAVEGRSFAVSDGASAVPVSARPPGED